MCMRPPNPVKQYREGGLANMAPPGMPTIKEVRADPKAALNPKLAIQKVRNTL